MEEDLFPIGARQGEVADLEEERRLFYVAVTRAKKELYLSHARSRFRFGEQRSALRSRFIDEIDPTVLRNEVGASVRPFGSRSEFGFLSTPSTLPVKSPRDTRIEYDSTPTRTVLPRPASDGTEIHYDADNDPFQAGMLVIHPTFGPGKILSRLDQGPDTTVTVLFQQHGQKKLVLRFAKLKPLHSS
jgi:DNA helicase-2/ATP-dependent DNA helicase PcrA